MNQPPIAVDFPPADEVCVEVGQTLDLTVGFIGPEIAQTVHTDVNDGGRGRVDGGPCGAPVRQDVFG